MMAVPQNFAKAWRERLSALRNVPAVLRIVWESGRTVVTLGLLFRVVASVVPLGLLWITKLIIDGIVHAITTHQPLPTQLCWLVAAEFALAGFKPLSDRNLHYLPPFLRSPRQRTR